ncbi:hypothetical protein [Bacillus bombysepticus]|uniref:hypothetical protein n=1 Tax=Bacillus bombysepticus TaxID=658666 RepID=UPI003017B7A3
MENVKISRTVNLDYEVRWTSYNGNFLMTINTDMRIDALSHRKDNPFRVASFSSGMIEEYYPGLCSAVLTLVKEHTKVEEHKKS